MDLGSTNGTFLNVRQNKRWLRHEWLQSQPVEIHRCLLEACDVLHRALGCSRSALKDDGLIVSGVVRGVCRGTSIVTSCAT